MQFFQSMAQKGSQFLATYPDGTKGNKTARYEVGEFKGRYRDMLAVVADTSGFDGLGFDSTVGSIDDSWHTVNLFTQNHRYIDTIAVAGADDADHAIYVALSQFDYLGADYGKLVANNTESGLDSLGFSADTIQKLLDNPSQNQHYLPIITKKMLIDEQNKASFDDVAWDGLNLISHGRSFDNLYRDMLKHDTFSELTEKFSLKQALAQFGDISELGFDSLMDTHNRLQLMGDRLHRALVNAGSQELQVVSFNLTKPFKRQGVANVAMEFGLSDGQSFSIFFKNPDADPAKIGANDVMVSWKWLLNKKDITAVVQPENGKNVQLSQVAMRMMKLAKANMKRFASAQAQKAKNEQEIKEAQQAVADKQALVETLDREIADLQAQIDAKRHEHKQAFDDDVAGVVENQSESNEVKDEVSDNAPTPTQSTPQITIEGKYYKVKVSDDEYLRASVNNGKWTINHSDDGQIYAKTKRFSSLDELIQAYPVYRELPNMVADKQAEENTQDDIEYDKSKFTLVNSIGNWLLTLKEDKNFVGVLSTEDSYDDGLQAYGVSINMPEDSIKKLYKLDRFKEFIEYNSVYGTYKKDYVAEFAFGLQNSVNKLSKVILEMFDEVNKSRQLSAKYPIYQQVIEVLDLQESEGYADDDVFVSSDDDFAGDYNTVLHNRTIAFAKGIKSVFDICQSQGFGIAIGDFNHTLSKGLFDSLGDDNNSVVVQIGQGDKIARCAIDDDGYITVLIGASGDKGFRAVKYDKVNSIIGYLEQALQESGLMAGTENESVATPNQSDTDTIKSEVENLEKDFLKTAKEFGFNPQDVSKETYNLDNGGKVNQYIIDVFFDNYPEVTLYTEYHYNSSKGTKVISRMSDDSELWLIENNPVKGLQDFKDYVEKIKKPVDEDTPASQNSEPTQGNELQPLPITFQLHKEFKKIVDNGDGYILAELTADDEFLKNHDFQKQLPFAEQRKVKVGTYILKTFPYLAQGVDDDKHKYTFAGALSTAKKLVKEFKNSNIFNNPHKGKTWQGLKGFGRIIVSEFGNSYYAYYEPTKEMVFIKGDVDEYIANDNPEAQLAKEQAEQEQTRLAEIQKTEQEAERQAKIDELERQLQEQKILAEQQQEILGQKAELIEDEVMPAFEDVKLYDKRGNKFEAVMRLAEQSQNAKQLGFKNNKGLIEHLAKQGYEFVKENEYSDDYVPMEYRSKFERSGGNYGSITSHYFAKLDDKSYEISEAEYHYGWHIRGKIGRGEMSMNTTNESQATELTGQAVAEILVNEYGWQYNSKTSIKLGRYSNDKFGEFTVSADVKDDDIVANQPLTNVFIGGVRNVVQDAKDFHRRALEWLDSYKSKPVSNENKSNNEQDMNNPSYTQSDIDYLQSIIDGKVTYKTLDKDRFGKIFDKDAKSDLIKQASMALENNRYEYLDKVKSKQILLNNGYKQTSDNVFYQQIDVSHLDTRNYSSIICYSWVALSDDGWTITQNHIGLGKITNQVIDDFPQSSAFAPMNISRKFSDADGFEIFKNFTKHSEQETNKQTSPHYSKSDIDYLQSIINGTLDLGMVDMDKMIEIGEKDENDPMYEQALQIVSDYLDEISK